MGSWSNLYYKQNVWSAAIVNQQLDSLFRKIRCIRLIVCFYEIACVLKARIDPLTQSLEGMPVYKHNVSSTQILQQKSNIIHLENLIERLTNTNLRLLTIFFYDCDVCRFSYVGGLIAEMAIEKRK